ncbi:hypothetical protein [Xylophilus sp. ASV27]|uniref:hypothetical protein n=1 Tax=Xylophilus sp. ASV27 TaxID=2795129 RepID=UPI0018ED2D3D|nr:hypothetical protein [Xylophilus sp. ASV27]
MGFAGLDLFFVISGFIMVETTRHMPSGKVAGGLRLVGVRFARIYSGWWPFFFVYWAAYATTHHLRPERRCCPARPTWRPSASPPPRGRLC